MVDEDVPPRYADTPEARKKRQASVADTFNQPVFSDETKNKVKNFFGFGDGNPDAVSEAIKRKRESSEETP